MRLALVIEAVESVGIGGGAADELMLLEIAPTSFDVVQLGGVFRQPFESEPGALGEGACCQLAAVDRSVVENCRQGPGAFGGAVRGAELVKHVSRWSACWRWYAREGAGALDQRRRAWPASSLGRGL